MTLLENISGNLLNSTRKEILIAFCCASFCYEKFYRNTRCLIYFVAAFYIMLRSAITVSYGRLEIHSNEKDGLIGYVHINDGEKHTY